MDPRSSTAALRTLALCRGSAFFYGISIYMYWNEAHHSRPHFHARYAGRAASIDLEGNLIAGALPRRALTLVTERARLHRAELAANWERARGESRSSASSACA